MKLQVGAKALIENEGRYLLLLRSEGLLDGKGILWDIPGGRIVPTEPVLDGLARELQEEAHLQLRPGGRLLIAQDIFVHEKDLHVVRLTFLTKATGTIRVSEQHQEYRWVSREQALEMAIDPCLQELFSKLPEILS
jgi:8-oxo-dGTP pyrophosphatase MutT (NUDIX family)